MDKIWYRNSSKSQVIGGHEKRMTTQNRQNRTFKNPPQKTSFLVQIIEIQKSVQEPFISILVSFDVRTVLAYDFPTGYSIKCKL